LFGCDGEKKETAAGGTPAVSAEAKEAPSFSAAVSEYPSWSAIMHAAEVGLIDAAKGKQSTVEKKWNVDIVLRVMDYDSCIGAYSSGAVDAAALTNIDSQAPALAKTTVAIFPTSTSDKADALIVSKDIKTWDDLKGKKVYGLENSVSHYVFDRAAEVAGKDPADFTFTMKDPGAAATAMQQGQPGFDAIVVWNPFTLETLRKLEDKVHVLGDSGSIPLEVLDLMVASQEALDRPGGDRFAAALAETFYEVNKRMNAKETRAQTLTGISEKFAPLSVEDMEIVVQQTKFFGTADEGIALYGNDKLPEIMKTVLAWVKKRGIVKTDPKVAYGTKAEAPDANFRYDTTYMKMAKAGPSAK
jgi:NitT/TauT family transport system substrate-binding protein